MDRNTLDANTVLLSNVVTTATLNMNIDLTQVAWKLNGEYHPSSFAAVQLRLLKPCSTALIFGSGRIVCTGSQSESVSLMNIWVFVRLIRNAVHPNLRIKSISIQNIVASATLGCYVRIDQLAKKYVLDSLLDVSLFPGLRLSVEEPKIKILVFIRGKIVLTGGKTRNDLLHAFGIAKDIIQHFCTSEPFSHKTLQTAKNARKKLTAEVGDDGEDDGSEGEGDGEGEEDGIDVEALGLV